MEIIKPHSKVSAICEALPLEDVEDMREMLKLQRFANGRKGYAIAHCQVSEYPLAFFVARKGVLPHDVVLNPEIISKRQPFKSKELCLSFPDRGEVVVERANIIEVKYQDENFEWHTGKFSGTAALVFQHEMEHFEGRNIYDNK